MAGLFDRPLGAPDNPEFWALADIVLKYDGRMQETPEAQRDDVFTAAMDDAGIDVKTVAYMAMQRAMRMFGITNALELQLQREPVAMVAAAWTEAFLFGTQFAEREK